MTPWRRRGLAVAAGALAALAHPPFGFLPGLLAYGWLMHMLERADTPRPLRSAFATGVLAGLGYFGLGVWWVAEAFMVDAANQGWMAPFAVTLLAGGMALFWGLAGVVYRRLAPVGPLRVLVFAGALAGAEWLRGHVLTGFPWNLPGETWLAGSAPSQAAAVVGSYGLTWITLAIAAGLTVVLEGRAGRNVARAAVAAVVLLYVGGALALARPSVAGPPVQVRIVQPDVAQESKYDQAAFIGIVDRYLRQTNRPPPAPADVVIWPEGAIPAAINDYLAPGTWTRRAIAEALRPGQTLLVGAYRIQSDDKNSLYFNSLIAVRREPDGELAVTGVYDKHRLVPGGEFLPFDAVWGALGIKTLVHVGDGFTPGPRPAPLALPGLPTVQPLICYESLFPGLAHPESGATSNDVRVRPRWIVNVSNDAWFGATSGPLQHLNLASYRAIEEGLPMVRATPTGVSAMIDSRGRVLVRLGSGQAGVIDARLPAADAPTPYARFGDLGLALMLLVSAVFTAPLSGGWKRMNGLGRGAFKLSRSAQA